MKQECQDMVQDVIIHTFWYAADKRFDELLRLQSDVMLANRIVGFPFHLHIAGLFPKFDRNEKLWGHRVFASFDPLIFPWNKANTSNSRVVVNPWGQNDEWHMTNDLEWRQKTKQAESPIDRQNDRWTDQQTDLRVKESRARDLK